MVEINEEYGQLKVIRHQKCLRCGRKLTSEKSIALGYGSKCYRITLLQKPVEDTNSDISFLKMEITMLKRQIKELKLSGVKHDVAIERIVNTTVSKNDPEFVEMGQVVREMKSIFSDPEWKSKLLTKVVV